MTAPALRKELTAAGAPDELLAGVPKPVLARHVTSLRETGDALGAGRLRQEVIDRRRALAEALAEAAELLDSQASKTVLASRAASRLRRVEELVKGWPQEAPIRSLVTAMQTGNPAAIRRAITAAERRGAVKRIGPTSGDTTTFDRKVMSPLGGEKIPDGAQVRVVRPGYEVDIAGERVVLMRPVVEELSPAEIRRMSTPGLVRQTDMRRLYRVDDKETSLRGRVEFIDVVEDGPRVGWTRVTTNIEYRVRESDGVHWYDAGHLEAQISPDGRSVWHSFGIDEEFQGQGFTTRHLGRVFEEYQRLGVERILIEANNEVGGYAWARAGFRFADDEARREFADWAREWAARNKRIYGQEFADEVARVAANPAVEPIDFAMIGHTDSVVDEFTGIRLWSGKQMMLGSTWRGVLDL